MPPTRPPVFCSTTPLHNVKVLLLIFFYIFYIWGEVGEGLSRINCNSIEFSNRRVQISDDDFATIDKDWFPTL